MDPISASGIALSVASLGLQVFTGCIQGIQLIITARDLPKDFKYLNLRLRIEEQRLFAWSETSGLMNFQTDEKPEVLQSNAFGLHRSTILDLLIQIQVLFQDFSKKQRRYKGLVVTFEEPTDHDGSADGLVPLSEERKSFIKKAVSAVKTATNAKEGYTRLRWATFDKSAFEGLLSKFTELNDSITSYLDARMQSEILSATQNTERGVLQLCNQVSDLQQLVMATIALNVRESLPAVTLGPWEVEVESADTVSLGKLAQLARFKAFNAGMEANTEFDEAAARDLAIGNFEAQKLDTRIEKSKVKLLGCQRSLETTDLSEDILNLASTRSEAIYDGPNGPQHVWIEWKSYGKRIPGGATSPSPTDVDLVQKLAALLHRFPKPDNFRVPHCLGYFDNNSDSDSIGGDDIDYNNSTPDDEDEDLCFGIVFAKPSWVTEDAAPITLLDLLRTQPKPPLTSRIALAHAVSSCLLYLHSVNWLHKGLRSENILLFPRNGKLDYSNPLLSGFDFSRPASRGDMTEKPKKNEIHDLYRHPQARSLTSARSAFRKSFDIYSLGVILVELSYWDSVDRILGVREEAKKGKTGKEISKQLMDGVWARLVEEKRMEIVRGDMGCLFQDVLQRCLVGGKELGLQDGEDETVDDKVAARLGMCFYERVVKKIAEIKV